MKEHIPEYAVNYQEDGTITFFQDLCITPDQVAVATAVLPESLTKAEQLQLRATLYRLMRRSRVEVPIK